MMCLYVHFRYKDSQNISDSQYTSIMITNFKPFLNVPLAKLLHTLHRDIFFCTNYQI